MAKYPVMGLLSSWVWALAAFCLLLGLLLAKAFCLGGTLAAFFLGAPTPAWLG